MNRRPSACLSRRHLLASGPMCIGSLALAWLMDQERAQAAPDKPPLEPSRSDLSPKVPHHAPRGTAMISSFMQWGHRHSHLYDPKPVLSKYDGKKYPGALKLDSPEQSDGTVMASPWKFRKHGQCGTEVSELLPHLAGIVDDVTVVRSMHTGVNNHVQSIHALNTGEILAGRPVLGSWITYGLGSESQNLPAYVALTDPESLPVVGVGNWSNGWLPSIYQGTVVRPQEPRIENLDPPKQFQGAAQE